MDNNGGESGGSTAFDGKITSLPPIKFEGYTRDAFIQHTALLQFSYADFSSADAHILAKDAVRYAEILADELNIKN